MWDLKSFKETPQKEEVLKCLKFLLDHAVENNYMSIDDYKEYPAEKIYDEVMHYCCRREMIKAMSTSEINENWIINLLVYKRWDKRKTVPKRVLQGYKAGYNITYCVYSFNCSNPKLSKFEEIYLVKKEEKYFRKLS